MRPKIMSESEYLERAGAGLAALGDAALHRQPGSTQKQRDARARRQALRDLDWQTLRARLRLEYAAAVADGRVRPPTRLERLRKTAAGHPDNPSVQAARRLLERAGE